MKPSKTMASKKESKKSGPQTFTMRELENLRIRVPDEFFTTGDTLIVRVTASGTLVPEIHKVVPNGKPVSDLTKLQSAPRVVAGVSANTNKSSKIERSRETLAFLQSEAVAKTEQVLPKPHPSFHSENVRYSGLVKNIKDNIEELKQYDVIKGSLNEKIKENLAQIAIGSLRVIEEILTPLAVGIKPQPLDELLLAANIPRYLFGKLSGGPLSLKSIDDLRRVLFPLKGTNWFYLTVEEILREELPSTLRLLNSPIIQADLDVKLKIIKEDLEAAKDNPPLIKQIKALQIRVFCPYNANERLRSLTGIPGDSRPGIAPELFEFQTLVLRTLCFMPIQGVQPNDFFTVLDSRFHWTRFDGLSPKATLMKTIGESTEFKLDPKKIESLFDTMPKTRRMAKYIPLFIGSLSKQTEWEEYHSDQPSRWFILDYEKRMEKIKDKRFLEMARNYIEISALKPVRYGPANSVLTNTGEAFIKWLSKSEDYRLLIPSVSSFLHSFHDGAYADLAAKKMAATITSGATLSVQDEIEEYGELGDLFLKEKDVIGDDDMDQEFGKIPEFKDAD